MVFVDEDSMDFEHPPDNPLEPFRAWLADAEELDLPNPNAMTLATIDPDGRPSARTVLLKGLDERGIVFYTNRDGRKGRALSVNPVAAMVFHWDQLLRQIVVEGDVTLAGDEESDAYFASRPRASQLGAWASQQSAPVPDRATLDAAYHEMETRFEGQSVPRPPFWGGYRMSLHRIEFWQARPFRLHDRIEYRPDGNGGWTSRRLYP
jgi:pyridoxamine 5'-phosphate oxidase